jgi:isochorismate synthase EntC
VQEEQEHNIVVDIMMEQYKLTEMMQKCPKEQELLTSINIFHVLIAIQTIAEDSLKDTMTRLVY